MDFMTEIQILLVSVQQKSSGFQREKNWVDFWFYTDSFNSGTKWKFSTSVLTMFGSDNLHCGWWLNKNVRNACDNQICLWVSNVPMVEGEAKSPLGWESLRGIRQKGQGGMTSENDRSTCVSNRRIQHSQKPGSLWIFTLL